MGEDCECEYLANRVEGDLKEQMEELEDRVRLLLEKDVQGLEGQIRLLREKVDRMQEAHERSPGWLL